MDFILDNIGKIRYFHLLLFSLKKIENSSLIASSQVLQSSVLQKNNSDPCLLEGVQPQQEGFGKHPLYGLSFALPSFPVYKSISLQLSPVCTRRSHLCTQASPTGAQSGCFGTSCLTISRPLCPLLSWHHSQQRGHVAGGFHCLFVQVRKEVCLLK